ncbi:MAG: hypothetical protein FJ288_14045 [Planctomycetes bacterium]|nr:hypothetical protein [Planctomycetota bacterium]
MSTAAAVYQFSLVKGAERYVVRCDVGGEEAVISQLMAWAEDPDLDFDWFDAAVLARQITQRIVSRALGEQTPDSETADA